MSESFYQLRKCLGYHQTNFHSVDITADAYSRGKFIIALDTEKVLAAGFTGLNTKAGDLMTIKLNSITSNPNYWPSKIHAILHADMILNIRDTGVEVFD